MTESSSDEVSQNSVGDRSLRRIAWLTLVFGALAALSSAAVHRRDWSEGLFLGSILAWLNFRWIRKGAEAFVRAAATEGSSGKQRFSMLAYLVALFRYALLALGVYVIFAYLHVPLVSIVVGLCALAVAALLASVWEILQFSSEGRARQGRRHDG